WLMVSRLKFFRILLKFGGRFLVVFYVGWVERTLHPPFLFCGVDRWVSTSFLPTLHSLRDTTKF
ncbi:hypothetical protein QUF54_08310, partial [Candidatus Marithioploca araucensis]|nr:hypothetical protein [Candidatus Marithioploca araucensis]